MKRFARIAYRTFVTHKGRRGRPTPLHMLERWIVDAWLAVAWLARQDYVPGEPLYRAFVEQVRAGRGLRNPKDMSTWHGDWKQWSDLPGSVQERWTAAGRAVRDEWLRLRPEDEA